MQRLSNKRILLGVTGGIAAYKSAELIRIFRKLKADIQVVMTKSACQFITPLTLQALSNNTVYLDLFGAKTEAGMDHITLAQWADIVLIAPTTADFIARLAMGQADDLLTALCLVTTAPICLAPAMNKQMWYNFTTQKNVALLKKKNIHMFGPESGSQACGDVGSGRMLHPKLIVQYTTQVFVHDLLSGLNILITAGSTHEAIDPIRFISNHSSGKMAFSLATAAREFGAVVTLISGPVSLHAPNRVKKIDVISARDMYQAVHKNIVGVDIFIGCAAVCDHRPMETMQDKIKTNPDNPSEILEIKLIKNPDIISSVADLENRPYVVGFAAETQNVLSYAIDKLHHKKLNLIIVNDVSDGDIGFSSENNAVTVLGKNFKKPILKTLKTVLSRKILKIIARRFYKWKKEHKNYENTKNPYS